VPVAAGHETHLPSLLIGPSTRSVILAERVPLHAVSQGVRERLLGDGQRGNADRDAFGYRDPPDTFACPGRAGQRPGDRFFARRPGVK
jgi:hypothetical protein